MGKYVERILSDGEVLLHQGQVRLLMWGVAIATYCTTELAATNKRVGAKFGLLTRTTIEINLRRMFDFGTVRVSGAGTPQATIPNLQEPMAFRRADFAKNRHLCRMAGCRFPIEPELAA